MKQANPLKYVSSYFNEDELRVLESLVDDLTKLKFPCDYKIVKAELTPKYGAQEISRINKNLIPEKLKIMHAFQFICGYFDIDLRDSSHIGHGAIILSEYTDNNIKEKYWSRIIRGELVGIAMTEPVGGSLVSSFNTKAINSGNKYIISGKKINVSRIKEADIFILVFKDNKDNLCLAMLDRLGSYKAIQLTNKVPSGLKGWSWGEIDINMLEISKDQVISKSANEILKYHFLYYRPLVCSLVLGSAARVLDESIENMRTKIKSNNDYKIRDTTLSIAANLNEFIRSYFTVLQGVVPQIEDESYINSLKANIIDEVYDLLIRLSLSFGANGFLEESIISKNINGIRAYMFADGINDALRRSSGKRIFDKLI